MWTLDRPAPDTAEGMWQRKSFVERVKLQDLGAFLLRQRDVRTFIHLMSLQA